VRCRVLLFHDGRRAPGIVTSLVVLLPLLSPNKPNKASLGVTERARTRKEVIFMVILYYLYVTLVSFYDYHGDGLNESGVVCSLFRVE
jgi:hypothetical protein